MKEKKKGSIVGFPGHTQHWNSLISVIFVIVSEMNKQIN